jgi:O-antigen ligase
MRGQLQLLLLFLLVLLTPSQLSLHFWPAFSLIGGHRVDYLSPTLYLTDFIIVAILLLDLVNAKKFLTVNSKIPTIYYLLFLFTISNLLFSLSPLLSLYKYVRLLIYFLLFRYLIRENKYFLKIFPVALSLSLLWTCLLAFWQFYLQHSAGGPWFWLGERPLNLLSPQVAKISLGSLGLFLRSYSTFPHPNALAGFLSISILLLLYFRPKLHHLVISVALFALLLTFSRSAVFLLLLLSLIYFWPKKIVPKFVSFAILVTSFLLLVKYGTPSSLSERLFLFKKTLYFIFYHPIFGLGLGNFSLASYPASSPQPFLNFQPVHNAFLLLAAELGLPVFVVAFISLANQLKIYWHCLPLLLRLALLDIIFLALIDHYWLTSHQNALLLAFLAALIAVRSKPQTT